MAAADVKQDDSKVDALTEKQKAHKIKLKEASDELMKKLITEFGEPKNKLKLESIFSRPNELIKLAKKKNRKVDAKGKGKDKDKGDAKDDKKDNDVDDEKFAAKAANGGKINLLDLGGGGTACTKPDGTYEFPDKDTIQESDIIAKMEEAYTLGKKFRVVGSNHSPEFTIFDEGTIDPNDGTTILVNLDKYHGILIGDEDEQTHDVLVTVDAGILLGSRTSRLPTNLLSFGWDKGIVKQLHDTGLSLTDLGGVVHQAAGGFLSMGCAGGTIEHDFNETISNIRLLVFDENNAGKVIAKDYPRPDSEDGTINDEFWGVVNSMGLCGVISKITFKLNTVTNATYPVVGTQVALIKDDWAKTGDGNVASARDSVGIVDFTAKNNSDENSLYKKLKDMSKLQTEYMRFFWAPQSTDNWIQMWKAHRATEDDAKDETYVEKGIYDENGNLQGVDYEQATPFAQMAAWGFYNILDCFGFEPGSSEHVKALQMLFDFFIKTFMESSGDSAAMFFGNYWYRTLCMDTTIYDKYMPFQFTELWCDLEDTQKAMTICQSWFDSDTVFDHKGTFPWEFYCAKEDHAWIRPNYGMDCFRIDILWFDLLDDAKNPYLYYRSFWEYCVINGLKVRPHWGKYCPYGMDTFPWNSMPDTVKNEWELGDTVFTTWLDYYKWILTGTDGSSLIDKFITLVNKNDPDGVLRNDYWSGMFGLDSVDAAQNAKNAKKDVQGKK